MSNQAGLALIAVITLIIVALQQLCAPKGLASELTTELVIPIEANDQSYDEMHVDGGTGSQVFVYPAGVDWKSITKKLKVQGTPKVYVIRNSFLDPDYRGVRRSIFPIGMRTIDSLIRTQGIGVCIRFTHYVCVTRMNLIWLTSHQILPRNRVRVLIQYT